MTETMNRSTTSISTSTSTSTSTPPPPEDEQESPQSQPSPQLPQFQPGDHVIRWELLPIAWPIQVHGIVLEVYEGNVVLVDFGLTAVGNDKSGPTSPPKQAKSKKRLLTTKTFFDPNELEDVVRSLDPIKGKQRLNVRVLSDADDIKQWKKVNYDGNRFGFGEGEDVSTKNIFGFASNSNSKKKDNSGKQQDNSGKRRPSWWQQVSEKFNKLTTDEDVTDVNQDTTTTSTTTSPTSPQQEQETTENAPQPTTAADTKEATKPTPPTDFTKRTMNPAMAKLLGKQQQDKEKQNTKASSSATASDTKKTTPRLTLPKADPDKLVLARTRWLLQHGESILPKYHCFHSNSECIAVFCKTGYWKNIQADVFLHSTAIGNAKTMGAATIGVAASVPLLAPVVGGLGLAMVGAPWLVLHKSKEKSEAFTQQLTNAFWAQAEPEVFVECITKWTHFPDNDHDAANKKEDEEQTGDKKEEKESTKDLANGGHTMEKDGLDASNPRIHEQGDSNGDAPSVKGE